MWAVILASVAAVVLGVAGWSVWYVRSLFKGPDYGRLPPHYPFKSEAARARYHAYAEVRAKSWPAPALARCLETSWGRTFVTTYGKEGAPPLVLLPSASASSLIWLPNAEGLAQRFRIHAVDNIYDIGRSVNSRPVTGAADLTDWLDELLDQLDPERRGVHLMGLSFGGWLASQYALRRPERLLKVVLAAPVATFYPLPGAWAWRAILGVFPPRRFFMQRFLVSWMCPDLSSRVDERGRRLLASWIDDAMMAMRCFAFRMPLTPTVLSDEELRSLRPPVLLLVGEHEVVYPAQRAVERVKAVAPSIATEVIAKAGHDLTIAQTETFNAKATAFLLGG